MLSERRPKKRKVTKSSSSDKEYEEKQQFSDDLAQLTKIYKSRRKAKRCETEIEDGVPEPPSPEPGDNNLESLASNLIDNISESLSTNQEDSQNLEDVSST